MTDNPQRHDWVERRLDGISWRVRSDYEERIVAACRSGWSDAKIVRATPHRRVFRVEGRPVIWVKQFIHGSLRGRAKASVRGTPARGEWRTLQEVRRLGLPAPEPIGWGEHEGIVRRESFLITAEVEGALPLDRLLQGEDRLAGRKRWRMVAEVAVLIRKAHDRGVYQRDLHSGNFLVREVADGFEIFLLDPRRIVIGRLRDPKSRWKNLGVFHGGCLPASRSDRLRFLKAYLSSPLPFSWDLRRTAEEIERKGRRHRSRLWRSRQRRCVADNREFERIQAGDFSGFARRDLREEHLGDWSRPETLLEQLETKIIKDSDTTMVGVFCVRGESFYLKRYHYKTAGYALKNLFRSSRARRGWILLNALRLRQIPVPLPAAYMERRRWGFLLDSYLMTRGVPGEHLAELAGKFCDGRISLKDKRALIADLGHLIRRMHDRRAGNRDLKPENIIAEQTGPRGWRLWIVDADGFRFGAVSRRTKAKNIGRIARAFRGHPAVVRTDGLRFLNAYLGPGEKSRWKDLWRRIAGRLI